MLGLASQIQGHGGERICTGQTKIHGKQRKTEKTLTAVALYASACDNRAQHMAKDVAVHDFWGVQFTNFSIQPVRQYVHC